MSFISTHPGGRPFKKSEVRGARKRGCGYYRKRLDKNSETKKEHTTEEGTTRTKKKIASRVMPERFSSVRVRVARTRAGGEPFGT